MRLLTRVWKGDGVHENVVGIALRRAEFIWAVQKVLDAKEDLFDGHTGLPIVADDRKADGAGREDVGMEKAGREFA